MRRDDADVHAGTVTTDLRHVHKLVMDLVWDVAPHPQAREDEQPGSFRRHDIQSFAGGMTPAGFPDVAQLKSIWLAEVAELPQGLPRIS